MLLCFFILTSVRILIILIIIQTFEKVNYVSYNFLCCKSTPMAYRVGHNMPDTVSNRRAARGKGDRRLYLPQPDALCGGCVSPPYALVTSSVKILCNRVFTGLFPTARGGGRRFRFSERRQKVPKIRRFAEPMAGKPLSDRGCSVPIFYEVTSFAPRGSDALTQGAATNQGPNQTRFACPFVL